MPIVCKYMAEDKCSQSEVNSTESHRSLCRDSCLQDSPIDLKSVAVIGKNSFEKYEWQTRLRRCRGGIIATDTNPHVSRSSSSDILWIETKRPGGTNIDARKQIRACHWSPIGQLYDIRIGWTKVRCWKKSCAHSPHAVTTTKRTYWTWTTDSIRIAQWQSCIDSRTQKDRYWRMLDRPYFVHSVGMPSYYLGTPFDLKIRYIQ